MRIHTVLAALALAGLGGCAHDAVGGSNYAGSPGSTYDAASNPPQTHGAATYNPNGPIVPQDFGKSGGGVTAP
jgi:hypothetical protein